MKPSVAAASVAIGLLVASGAAAQGKSHQSHGNNSRPSESALPTATAAGTAATGALPFAALDDAALVDAGTVWVGFSLARWSGSDTTELQAPVVDAAVGVTPRMQLALTVPRIVNDSGSAVGTTFASAKFSLLEGAVKLAVAPTLEVLDASAVDASTGRARVGLPVSVEVDRGPTRGYASAGFFTGGVRYIGAGTAVDLRPRLTISGALSHAWQAADARSGLPDAVRTECTGAAAYAVTNGFVVFAAASHTIATADENGAGATLSAGASFLVARRRVR